MTLKTLCAATSVVLTLWGCASRRIPGTEIDDNDDTRAILKVMESYRSGIEAKDAQKIIGLVADTFKDD